MMDQPKLDRARAHLDLWMHQNTLLWGRYATLLPLQAAVFAIAYAVHFQEVGKSSPAKAAVVLAASLAGGALTYLLWICAKSDWHQRNQHAGWLIKNDGLDPSSPIEARSISVQAKAANSELSLHGGVFWSMVVVDVVFAVLALHDVERLMGC